MVAAQYLHSHDDLEEGEISNTMALLLQHNGEVLAGPKGDSDKPTPMASQTATPVAPLHRDSLPLVARNSSGRSTSTSQSSESLYSLQQYQLWEAKNIVLDLLGWGVPPTHFIQCGLNPCLVYAIFKELHLRLPSNLSVGDLKL